MIYEVEKLNPIVKKHHISLLLLFGSRAKGNNSPESDLDLGVLFKSDAFDQSKVISDLISVFPGNHLDLAILNHADPVLKFEIISNYRILYCADPEVFMNFYTNTVKQYNDIQKFLKQEELYLNNYLGGAAVGVRECHPPQIGPAN
jgi:predicted nucleotidyltransferase